MHGGRLPVAPGKQTLTQHLAPGPGGSRRAVPDRRPTDRGVAPPAVEHERSGEAVNPDLGSLEDIEARLGPGKAVDGAFEQDAGLAGLGGSASSGGAGKTGLQLQRRQTPTKIIELHGKAAEQKLFDLGGRLVTDPDYSDQHKAIVGSHVQYTVLGVRTRTTTLGVHQWRHDGPDGFHMESLIGVSRPDPFPAVSPDGTFINAHNVGSTTIPLSKAGTYKTRAWVRAGVDNGGVFEGYELHIDHEIDVTHLHRATHEAWRKLGPETESFKKLHDTMDVQTALLRPGAPDQQSKGHEHKIRTAAPNPAPAGASTIPFAAEDARADKSKPLTYRWYVSPQTQGTPPVLLGGKSMVTVGGRTGYDFGTSMSIQMPAEHAGSWVVWYQAMDAKGASVGEASYLQAIVGQSDLQALAKHDKYMDRLDELGGKIEGEKVPLKGVHVSSATGAATQMRLFVGRKQGAPGTFILVDVTPGLEPKSNRLEYTGSTGDGAIHAFIAENKYPQGRLRLEAAGNSLGIDVHLHEQETTGQNTFDRLSSNLSTGGMVALGLGILAAPITRGRSLQVGLVLSGALTASGAAVSLYERLQNAEVSKAGVALDIIAIASSLISGGGAVRALRAGPAVLVANRATRFLLWTSFIADGVSGLLIGAEGVQQIGEILDDEKLKPEQKRAAVVRIITNLVMTGALLAVSASQMKDLRGKVESGLGNALAGQLKDDVALSLSMLDDPTLKTLKAAEAADLGKLAGALRAEPALMSSLKAESRLARALPLMKSGTPDELRFAIMRVKAMDAGVSLANSERLTVHLRNAKVPPTRAATIASDVLEQLGKGALLDDLDELAKHARSGKVKSFDGWLADLTTGPQGKVARARPWAAEARSIASTGKVDMEQPWGIDFAAWKRRLTGQGIKGDLDSILQRAKGSDADALAARGELRAAERARARGHDVEMLERPERADAQHVKSPDAKLTRGGEELRMEVKTATAPPTSNTWSGHATDANKQIKSTNKPGEITFDWTQVDIRAPGSSFPDQTSIERFINGKMTKDHMKSIRYFEVVWTDVDGKIVVTSRTRAADGTLGPVTSVKR
ncbi:MAG TPA: hypothetical protein VNO30_48180 [Kofleriaceae bacterium]|nr:hypothetical protein [Kofleriaceae bacterium]